MTNTKSLSCDEYMQQVQRILLDAHKKPQRFTEALDSVADYMSAETVFLWLSRKDSGLGSWYLATAPHPFLKDRDFSVSYPELYNEISQKGSLFLQKKDLSPIGLSLKELPAADREITSLMLYPVYWLNGKIAFLLGAINSCCTSLKPLEQISLSFLMAMSHYGNYHILSKMGKTDMMTGLLNRNSYHIALSELKNDKPRTMGCIYIDVNGLHEINNYLGHHAGDDMLRTVSGVILRHFGSKEAFRIGGDEFVLLCRNRELQTLNSEMEQVRRELAASNYEISFGIAYSNGSYQPDDIVAEAETRMRLDKQHYYAKDGNARNFRHISKQLEKLLQEKRDADMFLAVLKPEFKGVYFVDLNSDTVRHIFIPEYFEEILNESGDVFSDALLEYARRHVKDEYRNGFKQVCNYEWLKERLNKNELLDFVYQKKNGECLRLSIVKLQAGTERKYRTLWTFSGTGTDR